MTLQRFSTWLREANRGDRFVYHTGLLMKDRQDSADKKEINQLADRVWRSQEAGLVVAVQKRLASPGPLENGVCEYFVVKT